MNEDTHLMTRRNALKGIGTLAGTAAVGAGAIRHASEPVAAINHPIPMDDIVIETIDGEVTEFGISDLWFEVNYEHVHNDLGALFRFSGDMPESTLKGARLGVQGSGTETFGWGDAYADDYDVNLDGVEDVIAQNDTFFAPFSITDEDWLEGLSLDDGEDEKTVEVRFRVALEAEYDEFPSWRSTGGGTSTGFDVTVQRVEPGADTNEGEADAFGED